MDGRPPLPKHVPELKGLVERIRPEPKRPTFGELQGIMTGLGLKAGDPNAEQRARDFFARPEFQLAHDRLMHSIVGAAEHRQEKRLEELERLGRDRHHPWNDFRVKELTRKADQQLEGAIARTIFSVPMTRAVEDWIVHMPPGLSVNKLPEDISSDIFYYPTGSRFMSKYDPNEFARPLGTKAGRALARLSAPFVYFYTAFEDISEASGISDRTEHFENIAEKLIRAFFPNPEEEGLETFSKSPNAFESLRTNWPWINHVLNMYVGYLSRVSSYNLAREFVQGFVQALGKRYQQEAGQATESNHIPTIEVKSGILTIPDFESPETLSAGLKAFQEGATLAEGREREREHDRTMDGLKHELETIKDTRRAYREQTQQGVIPVKRQLRELEQSLERYIFLSRGLDLLKEVRDEERALEPAHERVQTVKNLIQEQEEHINYIRRTSSEQLDKHNELTAQLRRVLQEQRNAPWTLRLSSRGREQLRELQHSADFIRETLQKLEADIQEQTTRESLPEDNIAVLRHDLVRYKHKLKAMEGEYEAQRQRLEAKKEALQGHYAEWDKRHPNSMPAEEILYREGGSHASFHASHVSNLSRGLLR